MSKIQKVAEVFRSRFLKKAQYTPYTSFKKLYDEIYKQLNRDLNTNDPYEANLNEINKLKHRFDFIFSKMLPAIKNKETSYMKSLGKEIFKVVKNNPEIFTDTGLIFKHLNMFFNDIDKDYKI